MIEPARGDACNARQVGQSQRRERLTANKCFQSLELHQRVAVPASDRGIASYGTDALTNPNHTPNGADPGPDITDPPPADVHSPALSDAWNGVPPDVTGALPIPDSGTASQTVSEPPVHRAYAVSPGSIRNAESVLLRQIDSQIGDYNYLRNYVETAKTQNLYTSETRERLVSAMDNLLLEIGDAVELAGQFTRMMNNAAQSYAKADIDSYLPQT